MFLWIIKDKEEENTMRGCGSASAEALGPKIQSLKDLLLEPSYILIHVVSQVKP